jgi:putative transcriptional regulator
MAVKYEKLFVLMKGKGLTTYRIRKDKIISEGTLQSLRDNKPVSTETISALCSVSSCQPGDIMECVEDDAGGVEANVTNV